MISKIYGRLISLGFNCKLTEDNCIEMGDSNSNPYLIFGDNRLYFRTNERDYKITQKRIYYLLDEDDPISLILCFKRNEKRYPSGHYVYIHKRE